MFIQILVAGLVLAAICAIYKLKSMRSVDITSLVFQFMLKSRIAWIMGKLQIRPTATEITASNGMVTTVLHPAFAHSIEVVLKFDIRQDDVLIASYPKSGTTWMQEIVWLLCNNADTGAAKKELVQTRYGFLEISDTDTELGKGLQALERWPLNKQRMIKTHSRFELLPEDVQLRQKCKIIYVARNPKDICVSYYYFHRMNLGMPAPGTWNNFLANFCSGKVGWGSWFDHNLAYWKEYLKDKEQIYFVKYEDLKKNLRAEIVPLSKFLGKNLTDLQLDTIAEHCTFERMSNHESTNYAGGQKFGFDFNISKFLRKGEVGDWKNHFTLNENEAFDALYEEQLTGSGLEFKFDLDS